MAAQTKPEPENGAVKPGALMTRQQIKDEIRSVPAGILPDRVKHHLAEVKAINMMVAEISSMNWGKGLSPVMQRAVAEYCRVRSLDPTEIDILGGNIHRNAKYYLRRMSEMLDDGHIEYAKHDLVHADPRLDQMAKAGDEWAVDEAARRARIRIERGIPDAATGACVWHVKLRGVAVEFSDAKWCGGGTRKGDPVGDQFPIETAITRAARRTMRYVASQIPSLKRIEDELDEAGDALGEVVKEHHKVDFAREQELRLLDPGSRPDRVKTQGAMEDYGAGTSEPAVIRETPMGEEWQDDTDLVEG